MDTSTAQYMAAISLSNLTMYELTPLTWHVSSHGDNSLEGQVPHGEDASQIVNEWAEFLECDVTMTEYEDWTSLRLETNFGDYGTFIKIWGHTQTNSR